MTKAYHHPVDVLRFVHEANAPCALICVTAIEGGAMRARGALMAVTENGKVAGYISNGCVDADIIFQARAAIKDKAVRYLKYGEGSPFKDIQLPCGGSIELIVLPSPAISIVSHVVQTLENREDVVLKLVDFEWKYAPKIRLRIAGRGAAVRALASQAIESGFEVHLQSPELETTANLTVEQFDHLTNPMAPPLVKDDPWTALILMFHDHDWEVALLEQALKSGAFYIGAMGSPRTHALRQEALAKAGVSKTDINRVRGPIGLIPSMRDANLLALSTLAEIVSTAQQNGRL